MHRRNADLRKSHLPLHFHGLTSIAGNKIIMVVKSWLALLLQIFRLLVLWERGRSFLNAQR